MEFCLRISAPDPAGPLQVEAASAQIGERPPIDVPLPFNAAETSIIVRALDLNASGSLKRWFDGAEAEQLRDWGLLISPPPAGKAITITGADLNRGRLRELVRARLSGCLIDPVRDLLAQDLAYLRAKGRDRTLHLRLELWPDQLILFQYPWELLHGDRSLDGEIHISRYIRYQRHVERMTAARRLRLVVLHSEPVNLESLQLVDADRIRDSLLSVRAEQVIVVQHIDRASITKLSDALAHDRETPTVVHFAGHGDFGRYCEQCGTLTIAANAQTCKCGRPLPPGAAAGGFLAFTEDGIGGREAGTTQWVGAEELRQLFSGANVQLVVLNACKTALGRRGGDVFNGIAQRLMDVLPAVVASPYPLGNEGAMEFARIFYEEIGRGNSLVDALRHVRARMRSSFADEWYRPVLYLRSVPDELGCLLDPAVLAQAPSAADSATSALGPESVNPIPPKAQCSNAETQSLSDALDEAHAELERRLSNGDDATDLRARILDLRRRIREGGRLRVGDWVLDGRYKLVEQLKQGGFGTIYRAYDKKRQDLVAIKVLHGQYADDRTRIERFFRGARQMARLAHPGIVRVLEPELHEEGHHFFIMEYLAGGDLRDAVLSSPLAPDRTLDLIEAVGRALEYAHEQGVIHRDVKPANIVLDAQLNPKLTDFDLVRAGDTTGGTRTGFLGSFGYAAPEAMSRAKEADARADVYGLGMTAVFALQGEEPDFVQMLRDPAAVLAELPVPDEVRAVLQRATAWMATDRFESVRAFHSALVAARRAAMETSQASMEPASRPAGSPVPFRDTYADGAQAPEMVWLPGGTFTMGSPEGVGGDNEHPAHQVGLSHYAIGKYPVTVGEFRRFVEATGYRTEAEEGDGAFVWSRGHFETKSDASWRNPYLDQNDRHPVVCMSWNDAKAYCEWLSSETGQPYGLPTEAQWEHACRARTSTRWYCGDDDSQLKDYAWYAENSDDRTHPVGQKRENAFGLHDLHGNVWEWCADWYASDAYAQRSAAAGENASGTGGERSDTAATTVEDPGGPSTGSGRVIRGGSWSNGADYCRSACRYGSEPSIRYYLLGFRLSRTGPLSSYPFTLGRGEDKLAEQGVDPEHAETPATQGADVAEPEQAAALKGRLMQYDCFLSYNSKDEPAVRDLAKRLTDAHLSIWLDKDALQPGLPVQPQIEAGIRASRSVAVLVGSDGMGPWQDEEQQAALLLAVRDKRPVIPVLLPGASAKPDLPMFLQNRHWVDLRAAGGNDADAGFERLLRGITGTPTDSQQAPVNKSDSKSSKARRQALEQQLSLLTAQWQAALQESALTTGAAQVRAEQQAQQLEQRIREIERKLDGDD